MEYKASLDTLSKVITIAVFLLFIFIGIRSAKAILLAQGNTTIILIHSAIILFFIVIFVGCYLFSTQKYIVDNNELIIKRPIGDKTIAITDIAEIRLIEKGEMRGTVRTFGNGGFFGYYGKYHNIKFGSLTLYTTQRENRIYIKTKSGAQIIISPNDIGLVDNIKPYLTL